MVHSENLFSAFDPVIMDLDLWKTKHYLAFSFLHLFKKEKSD